MLCPAWWTISLLRQLSKTNPSPLSCILDLVPVIKSNRYKGWGLKVCIYLAAIDLVWWRKAYCRRQAVGWRKLPLMLSPATNKLEQKSLPCDHSLLAKTVSLEWLRSLTDLITVKPSAKCLFPSLEPESFKKTDGSMELSVFIFSPS